MKVEDILRLTKLYDAYASLLSQGQQEIMKSYLYDNFTVSEIAENLQVSRQAVKDSITKAEKKLSLFEEQLGFLTKLDSLQRENDTLREKINQLKGK